MKSRSTRIHSRSGVAARRDAVRIRHATIAEADLGMVVDVGVVEERRRSPDLEPLRARVDEEQRLLALRDGEHDVHARFALAGDEPLFAVQHPLVTVAHGGRREPREVGARAGLGERPGLPILPVRDRSHVPLDLLGVAIS